MQPSKGDVFFEDKRIEGPNEVLIPGHKKIGYLSQHFELHNNYRVEELLDMASKMEEEEAQEVFRICKIDHLLKRKTNAISGGERQRIALARVLVAKPSLLLLDEPFTNLDLANNKVINQIVRDLCDAKKTTCVLVSHDPSNILSWAERLIVLQDGKIVQKGSPASIYYYPINAYAAGLLGEFNAYSHSMATSYYLKKSYMSLSSSELRNYIDWRSAMSSYVQSYYEFKYFLLQYLLFAKENEFILYVDIKNDMELSKAISVINNDFLKLIDLFNIEDLKIGPAYWKSKGYTFEKNTSEGFDYYKIGGSRIGYGNAMVDIKKLLPEINSSQFNEVKKDFLIN